MDEKTVYPLDFRLHEEDNPKIEQAKEMIEDIKEKADVPAETYLFDCWRCVPELIETVEDYEKDWISVDKSDRYVEYDGQSQRIDAVHDPVNLTEGGINGEDVKIWTKNLPVS